MSFKDKMEIGLKPDAPYRPENLPDREQASGQARRKAALTQAKRDETLRPARLRRVGGSARKQSKRR